MLFPNLFFLSELYLGVKSLTSGSLYCFRLNSEFNMLLALGFHFWAFLILNKTNWEVLLGC